VAPRDRDLYQETTIFGEFSKFSVLRKFQNLGEFSLHYDLRYIASTVAEAEAVFFSLEFPHIFAFFKVQIESSPLSQVLG